MNRKNGEGLWKLVNYALKWAEDNGGNKLLLVDNMPQEWRTLKIHIYQRIQMRILWRMSN